MSQLKTIQDWDFLDNACNSSGIAHSLAREFSDLQKQGTIERNNHPIVKAYILKLCHLANIDISMTEYSRHYEEIKKYLETNEGNKTND